MAQEVAGDLGATADLETFTKVSGGRTETYLRNAGPRRTIRVTVRSVCHNPRMNAVTSYDVFPKQERRVWDENPGGPSVRRTIEAVTYAPTPGKPQEH